MQTQKKRKISLKVMDGVQTENYKYKHINQYNSVQYNSAVLKEIN